MVVLLLPSSDTFLLLNLQLSFAVSHYLLSSLRKIWCSNLYFCDFQGDLPASPGYAFWHQKLNKVLLVAMEFISLQCTFPWPAGTSLLLVLLSALGLLCGASKGLSLQTLEPEPRLIIHFACTIKQQLSLTCWPKAKVQVNGISHGSTGGWRQSARQKPMDRQAARRCLKWLLGQGTAPWASTIDGQLWQTTSRHLYAVIYTAHRKETITFSYQLVLLLFLSQRCGLSLVLCLHVCVGVMATFPLLSKSLTDWSLSGFGWHDLASVVMYNVAMY